MDFIALYLCFSTYYHYALDDVGLTGADVVVCGRDSSLCFSPHSSGHI